MMSVYANKLQLWNCQRLLITKRLYATSEKTTEEQSGSSHDQNLSLLKALDQSSLKSVQSHAESLVAQTEALRTTVSTLYQRRRYIPEIPPYRQEERTTYIQLQIQKASDGVITRLEHIVDHLVDMQKEPYPDTMVRISEWEKEAGEWTDEQKREELTNLRYEEEAQKKRLGDRIKRFKQSAEEVLKESSPPGKLRRSSLMADVDTDSAIDDVDAESEISSDEGLGTDGTVIKDRPTPREVKKTTICSTGGKEQNGAKQVKDLSDLQRQLDLLL